MYLLGGGWHHMCVNKGYFYFDVLMGVIYPPDFSARMETSQQTQCTDTKLVKSWPTVVDIKATLTNVWDAMYRK